MRRAALLAVDGGGSKTDVALLRRDGTVLGAARVSGDVDGRTWATWGHLEDAQLVRVHAAIAAVAAPAGVDPGPRALPGIGSFEDQLKLFLVEVGVDGVFTDFTDRTVAYLRARK